MLVVYILAALIIAFPTKFFALIQMPASDSLNFFKEKPFLLRSMFVLVGAILFSINYKKMDSLNLNIKDYYVFILSACMILLNKLMSNTTIKFYELIMAFDVTRNKTRVRITVFVTVILISGINYLR